jgi:hypothetical protein
MKTLAAVPFTADHPTRGSSGSVSTPKEPERAAHFTFDTKTKKPMNNKNDSLEERDHFTQLALSVYSGLKGNREGQTSGPRPQRARSERT